MKKAFDEAFNSLPSTSCRDDSKPKRINVLFVCDEWTSSKGGLSTFNREFAINLAKTWSEKINVHCYVSQSSEPDREDARKNGVNIVTAQSIPGTSDSQEYLRVPPAELSHPDIVIGHGRKFGIPAYFIAKTTNCKWLQFVHVCYEDLGKYKQTDGMSDTIEENAKKHKEEIELCKAANVVVAVGSRLQQKYSKCLPDTEVHVITPGILDKFTSLSDKRHGKVSHSPEEYSVFVFGRGSYEDLALKGYDIIADAVGSLGKKFNMTFVGSPEGKYRSIEDWFLQKTRIRRKQVTIRGYCDQDELKRMFNEADLVAMPSRTEGFGLIALEAISSAIPVLVTSESGIARALSKVDGGNSVIVDSEDPEEWSQKIRLLSQQKPEERHETAVQLRENYKKTFSWNTQCEKFKELILKMMVNTSCPADYDQGGTSVVSDERVEIPATEDKHFPNLAKCLKSSIPLVPFVKEKGCGDSSIQQKPVPADSEDGDHASAKAVNSLSDKVEMFHSATKNGNIELIELMLSLGLDIDSRTSLGFTPLMFAAEYDKPAVFELLIQHGADPSLKTEIGWSLLHSAAKGGNTSIINKLLSLGLDIDSRTSLGFTPLMFAAEYDKPAVFQLLIQHGADPSLKDKIGWSLLHRAAQGGNTSILNRLLSLGLDIDSRSGSGYTPLMVAAGYDKPAVFQLLIQHGADPYLKDESGWSLLHSAAQGGNTSIINKLLSLGLDIDSRGRIGSTPVMVAAESGKPAAFQLLIEHGADPFLKNNFGQSLLHEAAEGGDASIVNKLLSLGLNTDSRSSDGSTPLMFAAFYDKPAAFQLLLQHRADPSLKDDKGRSLLHSAAQGGNTSIINKLLSLGLDIDSRDSDGSTPLMFAVECEHDNPAPFQLLMQHGADPSLKNNVGWSLLHFAARGGNTFIINKLLSVGLDIYSRNSNAKTPLMLATEENNSEAINFLISKGALGLP